MAGPPSLQILTAGTDVEPFRNPRIAVEKTAERFFLGDSPRRLENGYAFLCVLIERCVFVPVSRNGLIAIMSQSPFSTPQQFPGGQVPQSPYTPPSGPTMQAPDSGNPLLIPGIILLALGALWLLYGCINFVIAMQNGLPPVPADAPPGTEAGQKIGFYGAAFGLPICALISVLGSVCLIVRKVYPLALTGVIINLIPCCSSVVILGIPFAIWAMVLLVRPEVKASFS